MGLVNSLSAIVLGLTIAGSALAQNREFREISNDVKFVNTKSESSYLRQTPRKSIDAILKKQTDAFRSIRKLGETIPKYVEYNQPLDQERLNTRGLYGYDVPTLYTDPKIFGNGKFGVAAFAEWYVDDEEAYPEDMPLDIQEKLDAEYYEKYGEKKYFYTIYTGAYLDYYMNDKITLSLQADTYPYSPKIYFPDHFGLWAYLTYTF